MVFITFNGKASTSADLGILAITKVNRPILSQTKDKFLNTDGQDGIYDFGKKREAYEIEVKFFLYGSTEEQLRANMRVVAKWLNANEPMPLVISDEPNVQYMARPVGAVEIDKIHETGECTVTFIVPEVFATSLTQKTVTTFPATNVGTIETPCTMTLTLTAATSVVTLTLNETNEKIQVNHSFVIGDILTIDTKRRIVSVNGIDQRSKVDIASRYFKLPSGQFTIAQSPTYGDLSVTFTERWI